MAHRFFRLAQSVHAHVVKDRRWLHQHPELSFEERETSAYIAQQLRDMGLNPETNIGGYGVRAVLKGNKPGPTVALRADMDALPIQEETGLPFASTRSGVMHACGHDAHTSMLLGAARAFVELDGDFPGTVVFIFQPAEEIPPGGAIRMVEEGVLDDPAVDAAFALHVAPLLPSGEMYIGPGAVTAASGQFEIIVKGKGGHGSAPHNTRDPIPAAAQIVSALQHIVSRNVKPDMPAVVSVCSIHGGVLNNIIASDVTMIGTIRTMDDGVQAQIHRRIEELAKSIATAHLCEAEVTIEPGYPAIVNTEHETSVARQAAIDVVGVDKVHPLQPSMGAEDFSHFLRKVPGSFARIGVAPPGDDELYPVHNARVKIHEDALIGGVAYFLAVVHEYAASAGSTK